MPEIAVYENSPEPESLIRPRILESLAGCHTMVIFAVFCKIGALERNAY